MRKLRFVIAAGILACVALCHGADLDEASSLQTKPSWHDLPGVDGKKHSLADLSGKQVVVVAVTCNHCPVAMEYFGRLKDFSRKYCGPNGKVALVAISVSNLETDKLPRMKELAEKEMFDFAYLHDETQSIGKQLGATVTPHFFVLDQKRNLVYRGVWDDNFNLTKVQSRYVQETVDALLAGKSPAVKETKAFGCAITYVQ